MELESLKKLVYEANMELYRRNMVIYTWGNVSGVDRERGIIVIKPSGVPYETMRPEQMVTLDLATGKPVGEGLRPSSDAPTHLALYRAFTGIGGVTHTHSPKAVAFAQAGRGLPCLGTTHADYFYGEVPITRFMSAQEIDEDYEGNTGKVIIEAFEGRNPVYCPGALVRGHGPFTWGNDPMQSVHNAVVLEECCKMALDTFALAPETGALPQELSDKHFYRKHGPNAYYGQGKAE